MPKVEGLVVSRRRILHFGGALALGTAVPFGTASAAKSVEHSVAFHNIHTGERLSRVYKVGDKYVPEALLEINAILRDWRTDEVHPMKPKLLDMLSDLRRSMGSDEAFDVISGYRSPKTNASLASKSNGVAKRSLHMRGMAIDVALPGRDLKKLREAALALKAGGVGYYPKSGFIHVDIGRVRFW